MSEHRAPYVTPSIVPVEMFHCRHCDAALGTIGRREVNGAAIAYLERWGDRIYHGGILCGCCGKFTRWAMNEQTREALDGG